MVVIIITTHIKEFELLFSVENGYINVRSMKWEAQ